MLKKQKIILKNTNKKELILKVKKKKELILKLLHYIIINSSQNNTIFTILNKIKKTVITASTGKVGFKGAKRSIAFAARILSGNLFYHLKKNKIKHLIIIFKGNGKGKKNILKRFPRKMFKIYKIVDKTTVSHNGCRLSAKRRI